MLLLERIMVLNRITKVATIIFISILAISCSCKVEKTREISQLEKIQTSISQLIESQTSNQDFINYFLLKNVTEKSKTAKYLVVIPEIEFRDSLSINFDDNWEIINKNQIEFLPDCLTNAEFCQFNISKEDAEKKVISELSEDIIKPLEAKSVWNKKKKRFIWEIRATFYEIKNELMHKANGELFWISPFDGKIEKHEVWRIL